MQKIFQALGILMKYDPDGDVCCVHDQMFACSTPPTDITVDDLKKLEELRWRWDNTTDSWTTFT